MLCGNGDSRKGDPNVTTVSVENTETWEEEKKFTVYKVVVNSDSQSWFVFRRYNEFYRLYESLKKQVPHLHLKLPGKKLFGNNLDPLFVQSRREGLDCFIQQLMTDNRLVHLPEVREFFQLDRHKTSSEDGSVDEESGPDSHPVNLGPSERSHAKPCDFEFLRVIGKGSFGKVLLARHKLEKRHYAVKVLSKRLVVKRNEAKHIMSERNVLLRNLNHPFLVGLHYSFQTPDKLYFVLDYVNGGELFFHLQRERQFAEPRARFYTAEMAVALGYLHTHGIVYRDLKPENLLLDAQGHVVLTDFGLSKEGLFPTDTTHTFCGTPEYLAPEVLRKEGSVARRGCVRQGYDTSVDWWCLGAVLYEMLYGLPPFYSQNTAEMYDRILNKPLRLRPTVSESARDILAKLLQKDRHRRLGSGYGDFGEVKQHDFFKPICWEDLLAKKISPPFNPNVQNPLDLQHIDPAFTLEPVPSSVGRSQTHSTCLLSASVREADDAFAGFSYAPPIEL
ncbi:serine/threonine-protein kinase Sgk1-like isoform X3 [Bacillus rossius redtenbacheri]|uniref:serine/threonine-protein kinase Sgk1-like isoform X3 n=1 Tax=Bacillus rossius redtenbacheri TaxID=93214 RepID=UPI002FDE141A